ncbi:serine hydrolase domain-containing protein [Xanthocytophaga agilis]|uniref:Serine hydrolase domain-containing protein n=1 Tax=Xanthocytophaga agilis TaxID=3048010 RepID=A0AAE3R8E8_9BACT|nr:serine hydrolase domain-containing protein [Xanthocytophaga agilis]MDJ1503349.1 serine hydrolase domain-containing protein [Xanthocytophaga agilis]
MQKIIFAISMALGMLCPVFSQTIPQKLDNLLNTYAQLNQFNGTVLIAKNGKILLEKGYGFQDIQTKTPCSTKTIYQIASVTKTFTSALVLKLAEQKKLSLSDKLTRYYPNLPHGDSITIEHLLTHTSGIPSISLDTTEINKEENKLANESIMINALMKGPALDFVPGSNWNYSNLGYALLGYIIQKVTGLSYYHALRHYIFQPLQMTHSGFDFIHLADSHKATGYYTYPTRSETELATILDSAGPFAAGAIYSTVGDLYKWHKGLQDNQVISKALQEKAYTAYRNRYGYGWIVDSLFNTRIVSHSGDIWGFKTNFTRVPTNDICIVLLSNIEDNEQLTTITNKILSILYQWPYSLPSPPKSPVQLSIDSLRHYTGIYKVDPKYSNAMSPEMLEIKLEGIKLIAQASRQSRKGPQFEITPLTGKYLVLKEIGAELEVVIDNKGKVYQLFSDQFGLKIPYRKVP